MNNYHVYVLTTPHFKSINQYKLGISNNINDELNKYMTECYKPTNFYDYDYAMAYLPHLYHIYCTLETIHEIRGHFNNTFSKYKLHNKADLYNVENNILQDVFNKFVKDINNKYVAPSITNSYDIHIEESTYTAPTQTSVPSIQITDTTTMIEFNPDQTPNGNHTLTYDDNSINQMIIQGDIQQLKSALRNEGITIVNLERLKAINIAVQHNHIEMVKHLRSLNLEPTIELSKVVEWGNLDMVRYFVPNIMRLDTRAVNYAIFYNHKNIVEYFISIGTQITKENIDYGITKGHLNMVKYLFTQNPNIKLTNISLRIAIQQDNLDMFEYLVSLGLIPDESDIGIAMVCSLKIVKYFVAKDVKFTSEHISLANVSVANYLIDIGVKPNMDTMYMAVRQGDLELLHRICKLGIKPNIEAANVAVRTGNLQLLHYIYELGVDPDIETANMAVRSGNLEILRYICNFGIMPHASSYSSYSCPLNINNEILLFLLSIYIKSDKTNNSYVYIPEIFSLCYDTGIKITNEYILANPTNNEYISKTLFQNLILTEEVIRYYVKANNTIVLKIIFDRYSNDPKIKDCTLSKDVINELLKNGHVDITQIMSWAIHCKHVSNLVPIQYIDIMKDSIKKGLIPYNYHENVINVDSIVYEGYTTKELNAHIEKYKLVSLGNSIKYKCATNLRTIIGNMRDIKELIQK